MVVLWCSHLENVTTLRSGRVLDKSVMHGRRQVEVIGWIRELANDAGHPGQPVDLGSIQVDEQLGVQRVLQVQPGRRRRAVPGECTGGQQYAIGGDDTHIGGHRDRAGRSVEDRTDKGDHVGGPGSHRGGRLRSYVGPGVDTARRWWLPEGLAPIREREELHALDGFGCTTPLAMQPVPGVGFG